MCVFVCVLRAVLLFSSNREHVVIAVIYHSDGLALPTTEKAEAATAWDGRDDRRE